MRRVALLLALVLLVAGCMEPSTEPRAWSFQDTNGVTHDQDTTRGAPVLLFFMATWCGSCRATAPRLAEVHEAYARQGLQMFSLSWDPTEDAQDLAEWQANHNQSWPHGVDRGSSVARAYDVTSQSTVVVLDAQGRLVQKYGYRPNGVSHDDLRSAVEDAFAA